MIVLGFNTTLFAYTGTGILWPAYVTNPVCQKNWWWHLLYINNFEESAKQCLLWCWSLAADMQFYIISPLFMVSLIRWPRLGYALILACIVGSCTVSFLLTYQYNLIDGLSRLEFHFHDTQTYMNKHFRDSVVPATMPVIKQRDTNEDCAKTLAPTENKLAEDANTSFIEEKSVKDRRPPKQGVKLVNGDLLPTKATQLKKRRKPLL
ncbi:hypothetical protein AVEN_227769-1 [Araneus ventricosus]|uniref:Nose resistant to fluoxetine protein 6 n=1 Tax=Araneus ventricosus TaxID=182803 RepID=A0A4Y2IV37_ARAVE|nr:hypothetical protein AVEN_227769-1 [Araneus ventricosus]